MKILFKNLKTTFFFIVLLWLENSKIEAQIVPGKYSYSAGTVSYYYEMYADGTFKLEIHGCLGKFFDGCGVWSQSGDSVYLTEENRQSKKLIMINDNLYTVYKSEDKLDSNNYNFLTDYEGYLFNSKCECHEKHYNDGKIQVKYLKTKNENTLVKIGYYHSGAIEYLINFDNSHHPVGVSYYFDEEGNILKTIDYMVKEPKKISPRKLRRMKRIQRKMEIEIKKESS